MRVHLFKLYIFCLILIFPLSVLAKQNTDPLPSWNNGIVKQKIISFVNDVTNQSSQTYVPPADRIVTIDDDGTLWLEQPMYTQFIFMFDRVKQIALQHPEIKQEEPYKSILENHLNKLTDQDLEKVFELTSSGMSVTEYQNTVSQWLATTINPHFKHHYTELVYQPMLEIINYLQQNNFNVYIVSGGGQDFMRAFAPTVYHIPFENIVGSTSKTEYRYNNGNPVLIKLADPLFISDKSGKPEAINLFIGKKPIIAIDNSDGDRQMLEWAQSGPGKRLMLLVHHDDAIREYAYDINSKIGTFSQSLFDEAKKNNWQIISMKNDWKVIFPYQLQN